MIFDFLIGGNELGTLIRCHYGVGVNSRAQPGRLSLDHSDRDGNDISDNDLDIIQVK